MRSVKRIIAASVLLGVTIAGAPASAAAGSHCAYRLVAMHHSSAHTVQARLVLVGCYGSFSEALAAGSRGNIRVAGDTTPASLTERQLRASSGSQPRASVLLGTEYASANFAGASNDYFASSTCTPSTTWQVANVGASWNDLFRSGRGFGGCHTNKKYRNTNFGGTVVTCTPSCTNYGSLNSQVSSLTWRT